MSNVEILIADMEVIVGIIFIKLFWSEVVREQSCVDVIDPIIFVAAEITVAVLNWFVNWFVNWAIIVWRLDSVIWLNDKDDKKLFWAEIDNDKNIEDINDCINLVFGYKVVVYNILLIIDNCDGVKYWK